MKERSKKVVVLGALLMAIAVAVAIALIVNRTAPVVPTENVPTIWEAARKSPMHAAHIERGKVACSECHTNGFLEKPSETACVKCHEKPAKNAHHGAETAPTTCLTCHAFGAGKQGATCVACHGAVVANANANANANAFPAGSDAGRSAHALAKHVSKVVACAACHDVHGDRAAGARVVLADCTACHASTSVAHGKTVVTAREGVDASTPLLEVAMRFATDARAAKELRDGGVPSDGGHTSHAGAVQVCTTCHAPHSGGAEARGTCVSCHAGKDADAHDAPRVDPRGRNVAGHQACTTCHEPHRATKDATRTCEGCHGDHRAATTNAATTKAGHTACTTCHTPHAPAEAGASCASGACHGGKTALASSRVAAHAKCNSCHDVHQPTKSPALACVRCHGDVQPKHPGFTTKTAGPSACVGCHTAHPATAGAKSAASATSVACSSCHAKAHGDKGFHVGGVTCTQCHSAHDFGAAMLRPHGATPTNAAALPKTPAKPEALAQCARCHAAEKAAVAQRPGHTDCESCHGAAHNPVKKPACATCHAQEVATAPKGHSACASCHDSHSGARGTRAVCTNCHAEKAKAPHGNLGNGCASCHAAHGPKGILVPPPCTTCHTQAKLEGLHSASGHAANCASCHSSHAAPRSDRATCTSSCHVDRRNHQPEAKLCKGCHMFEK